MPKVTPKTSSGANEEAPKNDPCEAGQSFGRHHFIHKQARKVVCFKCKTFMGCTLCCEIPRELLCLRCHDWATSAALEQHGHIVRQEKGRIDKLIGDLAKRVITR